MAAELNDKATRVFLNLFSGREEVFARQKDSHYEPVRPERAITQSDIKRHISGRATYGVYVVRKDNTSRFMCFDIDVDSQELADERIPISELKARLLPSIRSLTEVLSRKLGLGAGNYLVEDSGGRGYHLWVFFSDPVPARDVRRLGGAILDESGIECELFPKQDSVPADGLGNLIKLPLGLHRKYQRRSCFLELRDGNLEVVGDPGSILLSREPIDSKRFYELVDRLGVATDPSAANSLPSIVVGDPDALRPKASSVGFMFERCLALKRLRQSIASQAHLNRNQLNALGSLLANVVNGGTELHRLLQPWPKYDQETTTRQFEALTKRGIRPVGCRWMIERGICDGLCNRAEALRGRSPSPIRFADWRRSQDGDILMSTEEIAYERIAAHPNLRRAWEQVKNYIQECGELIDSHEIRMFQMDADANIECLHHELMNGTYQPQPYRVVEVPKDRQADGFIFRRKALMHPRDQVVSQALLNVVGPLFEAEFSGASLGRRLAVDQALGNGVFRPWQSDWKHRQKKLLSFAFYPKEYHYVRTDISRFYDQIGHTRLMGLLAERLAREPRITSLFTTLLKAGYVEDPGNERSVPSDDAGVPQGPAFSAFLANVYLHEVDQYMEAHCVDYVRYVDDIAFVGKSHHEAERLTGELSGKLDALSLKLNPKKTDDPVTVRDTRGIRKLIDDIKYGAAGLLSHLDDPEQYRITDIEDLVESLTGLEPFDTQRIGEMTRNLRVYLRARRRIAGNRRDDVAGRLALRAIAECALRPADLLTCMQTAIVYLQNDEAALKERLIESSPHPYARTVLAQALALPEPGCASAVAESLLRQLTEDKSSYLVRGLAYDSLRRNGVAVSMGELDVLLTDEASPFVKARALSTLENCEPHQATATIISAVFQDDPDVALVAAMIPLSLAHEDLANEIVKSWQRLLPNVRLLPAAIRAAIVAANVSTSGSLLEKWLGEREYGWQCSLLQFVLAGCGCVFQTLRSGQIRYVRLAEVQSRMTDHVTARAFGRVLSSIVAADEHDPGMDVTAVDAARDRLLQSSEDGSAAIELFRDYAKHLSIEGFDTCLCYLAEDRSTGATVAIEAVPIAALAESFEVADVSGLLAMVEVAAEADICSRFRSWQDNEKLYLAYEIPSDWTLLSSKLRGDQTVFTIDESLLLAQATWSKANRLRGLGLACSFCGPSNIIIGPGNETRFVNVLSCGCLNRYVSHRSAYNDDCSEQGSAKFAGMLSFEVLTGECPVRVLGKLQPDPDDRLQRLSDADQLDLYPQHYRWMLDRLTRLRPDQRCTYSAFEEDLKHFRSFLHYCDDHPMLGVEEFNLEIADALMLRVSREAAARALEGQSLHRIALGTLSVATQLLRRAQDAAIRRKLDWRLPRLSGLACILPEGRTRKWVHVSSKECLRFAETIGNWRESTSSATGRYLPGQSEPLIAYCAVRVEIVALLRAIVGAAKSKLQGEGFASALHRLRGKIGDFLEAEPYQSCGLTHRSGKGSKLANKAVELPWHVWSEVMDAAEKLEVSGEVQPIEEADLPVLMAMAALVATDMGIAPAKGRLVSQGMSVIAQTRHRNARSWLLGVESAFEVERCLNSLTVVDEGDQRSREQKAVRVMCEFLALIRSLSVARRQHMRVAERFKHLGESLRARKHRLSSVIDITNDEILGFPTHHLESLPGEEISVDVEKQGTYGIVTSCLIPSALRGFRAQSNLFSRALREPWMCYMLIAVPAVLFGEIANALSGKLGGRLCTDLTSVLLSILGRMVYEHSRKRQPDWSQRE